MALRSSNSNIFISVQSCLQFLPESDPRRYINIVLRAKENPSPNTLILSSKTIENSPKPVDPELGRFEPFLGQTGFGCGR